MTGARALVALTVAGLVLAGCSGAEDAADPPAAASSSPASSPPSIAPEPTAGEVDPMIEEGMKVCQDPAIYRQTPAECDAILPDTESDASDRENLPGRTFVWAPQEVRATVTEILAYPMDPSRAELSAGAEEHDVNLLITLEVENLGAEPLQFDQSYGSGEAGTLRPDVQVLVGPNGVEATGWATGDEWPARLTPGTPASRQFDFTYDSSAGDVVDLVVTLPAGVGPGGAPVHRFTGIVVGDVG